MGLYDRKKTQADRAELVRERFNQYYAKRGHGALKEVAEKTGYSRQHVGTFRNGGSVSEEMVDNINQALDQLSQEAGLDALIDTVNDPALVIAAELEALAKFLRSPHFDHDAKLERLMVKVNELKRAEISTGRAFDKFTEGLGET